jgi:hypothetical protein
MPRGARASIHRVDGADMLIGVANPLTAVLRQSALRELRRT